MEVGHDSETDLDCDLQIRLVALSSGTILDRVGTILVVVEGATGVLVSAVSVYHDVSA